MLQLKKSKGRTEFTKYRFRKMKIKSERKFRTKELKNRKTKMHQIHIHTDNFKKHNFYIH